MACIHYSKELRTLCRGSSADMHPPEACRFVQTAAPSERKKPKINTRKSRGKLGDVEVPEWIVGYAVLGLARWHGPINATRDLRLVFNCGSVSMGSIGLIG